jgi:hypothetical protein
MYDVLAVLFLASWLVSVVITALKGKYGFAVGGVFITILWYVGAIRLAKPDSFWARKLYAPGSDKLTESQARFASDGTFRTDEF